MCLHWLTHLFHDLLVYACPYAFAKLAFYCCTRLACVLLLCFIPRAAALVCIWLCPVHSTSWRAYCT